MAAVLALVSTLCFALAAALQQRGQFALAAAGRAVQGLAGLFRLVAVPVWLIITMANRETPMPGQPPRPERALADKTLSLIFEILALALASTVRPTSLAAVSALVSQDARRRLMLAYVVGGLAFVLVCGLLVVVALHGAQLTTSDDRTHAIVDIVTGAVALALGFAILTGRLRRRSDHFVGPGDGWKARLDRSFSAPTAAVAGAVTHIPGVFYLIALNLIVAHNLRVSGALIAVAIYDAVWFTLPIATLVLCVVRPAAAQDMVQQVEGWGVAHARTILLSTLFVVGSALVIRGALAL